MRKCPSCTSQKVIALDGYSDKDLLRCLTCTLVFNDKIPNDLELSNHYGSYGRNDFESPITQLRYHSLLLEFEKFRKNGILLDSGCGTAFFLECARSKSWEVYGTEFDEKAAESSRSRGFKVFTKKEDTQHLNNLIDVITSIEVLEHLRHPSEYIQSINDLLRPGGLFYLTTPNFNALNRRLLGSSWNVISYPEHLLYFNKKSLHQALRNAGFRKLNLKSEGLSPARYLNSRIGHVMNFSSDSSEDEKLRKTIEGNVSLQMIKKMTNKALDLLDLGESLKGWYVKL